MLRHHCIVDAGTAQQSTVHQWMQGLDPAIHHFREAGDLGHIAHCQPGIAQRFGGAAGGKQFYIAGGERARQFDQAGLVGNGQQRPANGRESEDMAEGEAEGSEIIAGLCRLACRSAQPVLLQFLAQGGAMDAEHGCGAALIAFTVVQHFHKQRNFHLAQHDFVQVVAAATIQVVQVAAHGLGHVLAQGRLGCATAVSVRVLAAFTKVFPPGSRRLCVGGIRPRWGSESSACGV